MSVKESPFATYRSKLIDAFRPATLSLQAFVLSLYNGTTWPFCGDSLSALDDEHFSIFCQLTDWYRQYTESCPEFLATSRAIIALHQERAFENISELRKLRASGLAGFEGSVADYYKHIELREQRYEHDLVRRLISRHH